MTKLLEFPSYKGKEDALQVVESLRKAIENEEIVAFAAVGITPDDETSLWAASTKRITRLKMIGAIATLQNGYFNQD